MKRQNTITSIFAFAILCHLIAAFLSVGFHHPDEHFQVFEFALTKVNLGRAPFLAWEYDARIRPWIQPLFYTPLFYMSHALFGGSGFAVVDLARCLSAALAIVAMFAEIHLLRVWSPRREVSPLAAFVVLAAFFASYLHVRTSSENISGLLLLLALGTYFSELFGSKRNFVVGMLLGASYQCRFQVGFALVGLFVYLLLVERVPRKTWLLLLLGFAVFYLFGTLANAWGYGEFVLSDYRYLEENLIKGKAAVFGVSPFYQYLLFLNEAVPTPLSLVYLIGVVQFFRKNPRHVLVFCTVPFFLGHCLIGHKELRFLFPITDLFLIMAGLGLVDVWESWRRRSVRSAARNAISAALIFFVTAQVLLGVGRSTMAADGGVRALSKIVMSEESRVILHRDYRPTHAYNVLPMKLYADPSRFHETSWKESRDLEAQLQKMRDHPVWILDRRSNCEGFELMEKIPHASVVMTEPFFSSWKWSPLRKFACRLSPSHESFQLLLVKPSVKS